MANTATVKKGDKPKRTLIATPKGRISFPFLVKPDVGREFSDDKYKLDLLFPKATWKEEGKDLRIAIIKEAQKYFGDPNIKSLSHIPKNPIKDGDDKDPEKPSSKAYKDHYYVQLKTEFKPTIVKPDGKTHMSEAEVEKIKGGDYARCVVSVFGYKKGPNTGISLGLQLVQFWKEGEAFGGGSKAASMELLSQLEINLEDVDMGDDVEDEVGDDSTDDVENVRL